MGIQRFGWLWCPCMLKQVCDAQSQFSSKVKLPAFAGARGLEITKSLTDSQDIFKKLVSGLQALSYNLLDVQVTQWHNDYHKFKAGVLDLEVMTTLLTHTQKTPN